MPRRTPPPFKAKGGKARRKRGSRKEERREQSGWLPGRDCGRWPGPPGRASSARAPEEAVHLFQSGGFYIKTNPPLGRPILSPAPASPSRGGWFTPRLPPITHCSSPRVRGTRHEGCPGTATRREPGAQRPRPRRLTFPMLAPGPSHMDFYNLTSPGPGRPGGAGAGARAGARACRIGRRRRRSGAGREGASEGGRAPLAGPRPGAGPGGADGRGGGTRRSPETRARAGAARPALRRAPSPAAPRALSLARSLSAALTHSQHSRGAARGAGAGTRAPPRGAAESARPGLGAGAGGFPAPLPGRPPSQLLVSISCSRRSLPGTHLQKLPGTPEK